MVPVGRRDDAIVTRWILVGLVLMILPVLAVLFVGMPEGGAGIPHPTIEKMNLGAPEDARVTSVLGWAPYLTLIFGLMMVNGLIFLGIAERLRTLPIRILFGVVFLIQAGVVSLFWFSYLDASKAGWAPLAMGFPFPTAVFFFAFYPALCLYCTLYVVKFRSLILPLDHEAEFEELVEAMKDIPEEER